MRKVQIVSPLARSGSESERLVLNNEGARVALLEGPPSGEDFGSLFSYAPSVDQIDIEAWIEEFHLPSGYDYRRPWEHDRACTPPPGYITVFLHSLQGGFRIPPLPFQAQFLRVWEVVPCFLLPNA